MLAALFVLKDGIYFEDGIDPWDKERDARKYNGPYKVIAHPPCERWGRYWGGGPMLHGTSAQKMLGHDEGCFATALWAVRTFGGILEHPEASHAWDFYGLNKPSRNGGWTWPDQYGGRSCCIAQGNYGHRAQKLTWLYAVDIDFKELEWGLCPGKQIIEQSMTKKERARAVKTGVCQNMSSRQRQETPKEFRDLLIELITPPRASNEGSGK